MAGVIDLRSGGGVPSQGDSLRNLANSFREREAETQRKQALMDASTMRSLQFTLEQAGDREQKNQVLREWVAANPDQAQRLGITVNQFKLTPEEEAKRAEAGYNTNLYGTRDKYVKGEYGEDPDGPLTRSLLLTGSEMASAQQGVTQQRGYNGLEAGKIAADMNTGARETADQKRGNDITETNYEKQRALEAQRVEIARQQAQSGMAVDQSTINRNNTLASAEKPGSQSYLDKETIDNAYKMVNEYTAKDSIIRNKIAMLEEMQKRGDRNIPQQLVPEYGARNVDVALAGLHKMLAGNTQVLNGARAVVNMAKLDQRAPVQNPAPKGVPAPAPPRGGGVSQIQAIFEEGYNGGSR